MLYNFLDGCGGNGCELWLVEVKFSRVAYVHMRRIRVAIVKAVDHNVKARRVLTTFLRHILVMLPQYILVMILPHIIVMLLTNILVIQHI